MGVAFPVVFANSDGLRAGSRLVWCLIAVMALTAAGACWAANLSITWLHFPTVAVAIPGCASVALFYRFFRPEPAIVYITELLTQIFIILLLGDLLAYGAAATRLPYCDAALLAADRWLGFDVRAYVAFVNARPWLAALNLVAYMTMLWQALAVFVLLTLTGRLERLQDFAVSLIVSLGITIAIFALFPALGWFGYLHTDPADFPNILFLTNFVEHLEDVRSGALHAIPLDDIRGVISFPSYHAAAGVLAVWALWPLRWMRGPLLVLNALMLAATPIEGAHYLVDVIGGVAVAAGAILIAVRARHAIVADHGADARGRAAAALFGHRAAKETLSLEGGGL
jgi:membrane-associated phospholipid phosphatase